MLRQGQTSPQGVLLVNATSHFALVEFNGKQLKLGLGQDRGNVFKEALKTNVTIYPDDRGMYWTSGAINNIHTRFMVDTGATFVAINSNEAAKLRVLYKDGERIRISTANGIVLGYKIKLDRVDLGALILLISK